MLNLDDDELALLKAAASDAVWPKMSALFGPPATIGPALTFYLRGRIDQLGKRIAQEQEDRRNGDAK